MSSIREVPLPLPTSRTRIGPIAALQPPKLTVEYDCEEENGVVRWARIRFHEVLKFEYRQDACCLTSDLEAYSKMQVIEDSPDLADVRGRYIIYLSRVAAVEESLKFLQFKVYFDDSGCVDVIAHTYEIDVIASPGA
jgi:hypothetical protein